MVLEVRKVKKNFVHGIFSLQNNKKCCKNLKKVLRNPVGTD